MYIKHIPNPTFDCDELNVERTTINDRLSRIEFRGDGCCVTVWDRYAGNQSKGEQTDWEGNVQIPGTREDLYYEITTVEEARAAIIELAKRNGFVEQEPPAEQAKAS